MTREKGRGERQRDKGEEKTKGRLPQAKKCLESIEGLNQVLDRTRPVDSNFWPLDSRTAMEQMSSFKPLSLWGPV